jgi:hypothetical protein
VLPDSGEPVADVKRFGGCVVRADELEGAARSPLAALRPGLATACGSLPHADRDAAAQLVLEVLGDCPAAPTLPNAHPAEGMLGQAATGLEGVVIGPDGGLVVADPDRLDPDAPGIGSGAGDLPGDAFGATLAFLDRVAASPRRPPLVKLQSTGPVTFGTALVAAGVAPRVAYRLAGVAAKRRARALVAAAQERLGDQAGRTAIVLVVDEPSLGAATLGRAPVSAEDAVDLVSGVLAAIEANAVAGIHCCAPADWGLVLRSGPALLSFPVEIASTVRAPDLGPFLEGGGWVAWGAVPTDGPLGPLDGGGARRLWRHLAERWHVLADGGVDPVLLRQRALVTPACGLARHDETQAALALHLTADLGERIAAGTLDGQRRALS